MKDKTTANEGVDLQMSFIEFNIKLNNKSYSGKYGYISHIDPTFFIMLNMLEMFGKKQYDFMIRNQIIINDKDEKLWNFIENAYIKTKNEMWGIKENDT